MAEDQDDWCDRCFGVDAYVKELERLLEADRRKLATLHRVMGVGERMGDSDDVIMKEIRQVLWHG